MPALNLRMIGLAIAAAGLFALGWVANGWRLGAELEQQGRLHSESLAEIARAAAHQVQTQQAKRTVLEQQLAAIDEQHYKELQNAQTVTDALTADLATARQRLSVRITGPACSSGMPTATNPAGMDDDPGTRAELHPSTAAGVIRVTGRADMCRARLSALQSWVRIQLAGVKGITPTSRQP